MGMDTADPSPQPRPLLGSVQRVEVTHGGVGTIFPPGSHSAPLAPAAVHFCPPKKPNLATPGNGGVLR